ncbi:type IV secretory system conjugative DNA transfer family protein [Dyadobacter frigoris]|uniref:Type IV secretory system conjugative DNA transfer family protein n=1 Tax=Dyadobacter frigoris TaxID=2576211 RepID=A0A4U6CPE4_9BACT|nr:type IV secretory system conjugative DNA transfer family protein [Dyadobacter frigoris]TKT85261.1 hypothetical protein FDK13_34275 [Dyadobacter frigoris]
MMQSEKLILGRQDSGQSKAIGFSQQVKSKRIKKTPELIYHDMNAHLCTISRTGGGKGVSSVIPNLLDYPGSMVVLDLKGDLSAVTARGRSPFGKVIHISPFDNNGSDAFNPLFNKSGIRC